MGGYRLNGPVLIVIWATHIIRNEFNCEIEINKMMMAVGMNRIHMR
jgi:hypothetical protein